MKWIHSFNIGDLDMATYTILNNMLDEISKKIKHIVKKCEANNIDYTFNVGNKYTKIVSAGDEIFEICLVDLDLNVMFKFNGLTALGMVQQKDGIIQCYFDDASLIKQYKDTSFHCDHCHKKFIVIQLLYLRMNQMNER